MCDAVFGKLGQWPETKIKPELNDPIAELGGWHAFELYVQAPMLLVAQKLRATLTRVYI